MMRLPILILFAMLNLALAQTPKKGDSKAAPHAMTAQPVMQMPADIKWIPSPVETGLPSTTQMSVLSGDPSKPGMFTIRGKIPAGTKIAPHWHPTDEHVTVLQGTFSVGMGEKADAAAARDFPAGSYLMMPKEMRHFVIAKTDSIIQVHAMGPFVLNYVNPADDPRKK
jgi:quercetin dioxygenase-like cupin family protein